MNQQPLSQAHDADLRFSQVALERAAQRARELAVRTGTVLIVSHKEATPPDAGIVQQTAQEPAIPPGK